VNCELTATPLHARKITCETAHVDNRLQVDAGTAACAALATVLAKRGSTTVFATHLHGLVRCVVGRTPNCLQLLRCMQPAV